MTDAGLTFTFGIEEEFFLVDPQTRDIIADPNPAIIEQCQRTCGPHSVVPEFLRSQLETNTRVCASITDLRMALTETRRLVAEAAAAHGARVMATSTHPFAAWREQLVTPKQRYREFEIQMQEVVRRFLVGGMHIHAGFGDPDSRIRVMTAARRYLPLFIALSASSPFNAGSYTGFSSYRSIVIGALPRTGMPRAFGSQAEFDDLVTEYRRAGSLRDSSELWLDIRPHNAFPTIELRICDICPRMDDAIALAALYAATLRWLQRRDASEGLPPEPSTEIIIENCWRARRYGTLAFIGDAEHGGHRDIADSVEALLAEVAEDARALDCERELCRIPSILRDGSSADRQVERYRLSLLDGADRREALHAVVDQILAETCAGISDA
ncbi:MAG: carboxylate-amine ligase [Alphaproteobacteria bacterium]|nr:carboxylate-amine ligase [Alphaproteobacteria bacterium]MCY4320750.1 carboxylate-amine ligase [Alphaproteobacteria bacterium]